MAELSQPGYYATCNQKRQSFDSMSNAMSGGGGYTLTLTPRDRVDYSVSKGGLRLWAVLFVFIVLCSSLFTLFSVNKKINWNVPVDLDGNDAVVDAIDIKLEKEMTTDAAATDRDSKLRPKTPTTKNDDNNNLYSPTTGDAEEKEVVDDTRGSDRKNAATETNPGDAPAEKTTKSFEKESPPTAAATPKKTIKLKRKYQEEEEEEDDEIKGDQKQGKEDEEDEEDQAEARAREEMMLRALKEKADARRQARQEKRAAKKAARQAARQEQDDNIKPEQQATDADDDKDEDHQKPRTTRRKPRTLRKVRSTDAALDGKVYRCLYESKAEKKKPLSSTKKPPPEPEPESQATDDEDDQGDDSPKSSRRRQVREGRKSKYQQAAGVDIDGETSTVHQKIRYTRKKGKNHRHHSDNNKDEETETSAEDGEMSTADEERQDQEKNFSEEDKGGKPKRKRQGRHRKAVDIIFEDDPDDEADDLFDQRSIRIEKRKKQMAAKKSTGEEDKTVPEGLEDKEEPVDETDTAAPPPRKEPIVIRYTRTKGKILPKKPKKKKQRIPELDNIEKEAQEEDSPTTSATVSSEQRIRPTIERPIRYKRTKGNFIKRPSNADRAREAVTVDIPAAEADLDAGNCRSADDDCNEYQTVPIEVRYFRTKGSLLPKKKKNKKIIPVQEEEEEEEEVAEEDIDSELGNEAEHEADEENEAENGGEEDEEEEYNEGGSQEKENKTKEHQKDHGTVKLPRGVSLKMRYRKREITNEDDNLIRHVLDVGDKLIEDERKYEAARDHFFSLLKTHSKSPRINYGYARALDRLSENRRSNAILETCIEAYEKVLDLPDVPEPLYRKVLDRMVDRVRFRGWPQKAMAVQRKAVQRFPNNYDIRNQYGLTFLLMGRNQDAKRIFQEVIHDDVENWFAHMHYGFILKTIDGDQQGAVRHMSKGMATGAEGTNHARFYFHLGDALQRTGKKHQAYKLYDEGAAGGHFLSRMQRSMYNCDGLTTGRPWWTLRQTGVQEQLEELERHWQTIRTEGLALLEDSKDRFFKCEDEKLTKSGDWKQFTLFQRGKKVESNCARAPKTCALIEQFKEAAQCRRGQVKFSVMTGGTRVHPHCGPTNCRLRAHLGLTIPVEPRIRVSDEVIYQSRHWRLGKFIVLDDSFEHEVWHDGTLPRLILIVDFWHPQVTPAQRKSLSVI